MGFWGGWWGYVGPVRSANVCVLPQAGSAARNMHQEDWEAEIGEEAAPRLLPLGETVRGGGRG